MRGRTGTPWFLLLAALLWGQAAPPASAAVVKVFSNGLLLVSWTGAPRVQLPGGGAEPALKAGLRIPPGARLSTGAKETATLADDDGSSFVVSPLTRLVVSLPLEKLLQDLPNDRPKGASLELEDGTVQIEIAPKAGEEFRMKTPANVLGVKGTVFRVSYTNRFFTLSVLEGEVEVGGIAVSPGLTYRVRANQQLSGATDAVLVQSAMSASDKAAMQAVQVQTQEEVRQAVVEDQERRSEQQRDLERQQKREERRNRDAHRAEGTDRAEAESRIEAPVGAQPGTALPVPSPGSTRTPSPTTGRAGAPVATDAKAPPAAEASPMEAAPAGGQSVVSDPALPAPLPKAPAPIAPEQEPSPPTEPESEPDIGAELDLLDQQVQRSAIQSLAPERLLETISLPTPPPPPP